MLEVALGVIGSALAVTNGVIIWICTDLKREFSQFREDCRVRHECVMMKEDFWREHSPLEKKVDAMHSRLDRIETREELLSGRADRSEARELDRS